MVHPTFLHLVKNFYKKDLPCKDAGIVGITRMLFLKEHRANSVQEEICEEFYHLFVKNNVRNIK